MLEKSIPNRLKMRNDGSKKWLEAIKNNNQATKHIITHIEVRAYILKYTNDLTTPHSIVFSFFQKIITSI